MSDLRTLAASVLLPGFRGTTVPGWLASRLDAGLAGVCLFGHNIVDDDQVRDLTAALHGHGSRVIVASDEEGGTVSRLDAKGGSPWPGHGTLGALDDVEATESVAGGIASRLRDVGIDLALAPVVDVNSEPDNPVIGVRSFGATPELVARHGAAFVRGVQSGGVAACAKHFPGHGATRTDSHRALPVLDGSVDVVRSRDLPPFTAAIEAGVACVMTAHVVVSGVDDRPATMSPALLRLLREELGFRGVVLTDALDMRAISDGVGRAAGGVLALAAGADLVCVGNPDFPEPYDDEAAVDELIEAIVSAVRSGQLSRRRLQEASDRVGTLARHRWTAGDGAARDRAAGEGAVSPTDPAPGRTIASRALRVDGDVRVGERFVVVIPETETGMAAGRREPDLLRVLAQRRPEAEVAYLAAAEAAAELTKATVGRDLVVVLDGRLTSVGAEALAALLSDRPDAVVVDASVAGGAGSARRVVRTFGGGRAVAEAVADLVLEGEPQ